MAEQGTHNAWVAGSIPAAGTPRPARRHRLSDIGDRAGVPTAAGADHTDEMRVPGRAVAAVCLLILIVLAAGAAIESALVHPTNLSARLRSDISDTVSAPGFTLQIVYESQPGPKAPAAQRAALASSGEAVVTYRAPDRLQIVAEGVPGHQEIELFIGSHVYVSYDSGAHWSEGRAQVAGTNVGAVNARHILQPLRDAAQASDLTASGDQLSGLLAGTAFVIDSGLSSEGIAPSSVGQLQATVSHGRLQALGVRFNDPERTVAMLYRITAVGSAPPVVAPDPASITPAPKG